MSNTCIIANNISLTMQGSNLLNNISFSLPPGGHLAITGPSGSGKTMLARVLAGQLLAKGSVVISYDESWPLQKKVWLTEQRNQFKNLSHTSEFYYQQRFNSFDANDALTVIQALQNQLINTDEIKYQLQQFGMLSRADAPLIQLSSGENKRFQLIKAILSQAQVLLFDSPFTGLDKQARKHLHQVMNALAKNGTTIIVIADIYHLPDCITHIASLHEGSLQHFFRKEDFQDNNISSPAHEMFDLQALPLSQTDESYHNTINMKNVSVAYNEKIVLRHVNWQVNTGEKWLLRGHNGAGKSTLLSLINGDNPQAYKNEIYLFGKRRGSGESIWDIKRKTGFVSPELHAFYDKQTTCFNAIASGFFDTIGLFKRLSAEQQEQVKQWINCLQLSHVQNKSFGVLSFGMQRLVLLARALVKNPPLLILDEPCQGLDDEQKEAFVSLVNDICIHFNKTLIYVSHYDNEVPACIEHVIELKNGEQKIYAVKKQAELI